MISNINNNLIKDYYIDNNEEEISNTLLQNTKDNYLLIKEPSNEELKNIQDTLSSSIKLPSKIKRTDYDKKIIDAQDIDWTGYEIKLFNKTNNGENVIIKPKTTFEMFNIIFKMLQYLYSKVKLIGDEDFVWNDTGTMRDPSDDIYWNDDSDLASLINNINDTLNGNDYNTISDENKILINDMIMNYFNGDNKGVQNDVTYNN